MTDDDVPPPLDSTPPEGSSDRSSSRDARRRRLEGVIPELVRRAVEIGVEKAQEAPDNLKSFVGEMKVPKEIAHYLLQQIDETKNGLFRVVGKEVHEFLEHTNFAGELQKLLTTVQFEVNTTIRFTPNEQSPKGSTRPSEPPNEPASGTDAAGAQDSTDSQETRHTRSAQAAESDRGSGALPKPEVKTAVNIRRDDRSARRGRDREP
jgi:hypothetical protein